MSSSPRIRIPQSMSYFDVTEYRPWDSRGKDRNGFTGRIRSISRIRPRSICWQAGAGQAPPFGFALNNQAGSWSGWTNHAANGQMGGRRRRRKSQSWVRSAPALRGCQFVLRQPVVPIMISRAGRALRAVGVGLARTPSFGRNGPRGDGKPPPYCGSWLYLAAGFDNSPTRGVELAAAP